MKTALWLPVACACLLALPSCQTGSNGGAGPSAATGPFDSSGNYREDWADSPSKWRKSSDSPSPHELGSDVLPDIAKNDQPPENSNPLPPKSSSKPVPIVEKSKIVNKSKAKPKEQGREVEVASSKPKSTTKSTTKTASKSSSTKSTSSKSKPKSSRYTVKAGDSLSSIASRNGTSVSAIQRENGISGTMIHPGQSLTLPKK